MLRTCENMQGGLVSLNMWGCWVGLNGGDVRLVGISMPNTWACLFKVRLGILSKTLSIYGAN